jgi:hypothetical protein
MRFFIPSALAVLLLVNPISHAEDAHGGEGTEYEYSNSNNDYEFGAYGAGPGGASDDPFYVPSDVRDLFEDMAMKTNAEARAKMEKEKGNDGLNWDGVVDGTTVLVEKKTVRRISAPTRTMPNVSSATTSNSQGRVAPGASASVTQNVTPAVIVNNILPTNGNGEKASFEEASAIKEEAQKSRETTKAFKPLWLEAQSQKQYEKIEAGTMPNIRSAGWLDKLRSWWFRGDGSSAAAKGTTRRLIVTAEEEVPAFDQAAPVRNLTREPGDITSSQSWFGWIGWVVALMLLGLLVARTKKELV